MIEKDIFLWLSVLGFYGYLDFLFFSLNMGVLNIGLFVILIVKLLFRLLLAKVKFIFWEVFLLVVVLNFLFFFIVKFIFIVVLILKILKLSVVL